MSLDSEKLFDEEYFTINPKILLKEFSPDSKIYKEYNPFTDKFVDKSHCLCCDSERKQYPTMYLNEGIYGCFRCGDRGTGFTFLKNNFELNEEQILKYIVEKSELKLTELQKEEFLEQIKIEIYNVSGIFHTSEFFPGTACIPLGFPGSEKVLTDYISIRKEIWKLKKEPLQIEQENEEDFPF